MWLSTAACVLTTVPRTSPISALIIAACVTSTDPVLSQAVAKGPFSDKYVARPLREIISAEAGANDGFASPFLILGISLVLQTARGGRTTFDAAEIGGAIQYWVIEALLYTVLLAIVYGVIVGCVARKIVELSLLRKWIDTESYLLFPTALGVNTTQELLLIYAL